MALLKFHDFYFFKRIQLKYSRLILIGCFLSSSIFAQEKKHLSEKIVSRIQSGAGVWGLLTIVSSIYAVNRIHKFAQDFYYDYTLKDYGNFWTEKELKQLRIDRMRRHIFEHFPYVVIPLLMTILCVQETKGAIQKQKRPSMLARR